MKLQLVACAFLLFGLLGQSATSKDFAGEEARLADFIENRVRSFSPIEAGLDPITYEGVKDFFVITPNLEISGEIWGVSFTGFSNMKHLTVDASVDIRPDEFYATYHLNYTFPAILRGNYRLSGVWKDNETQIAFSGEDAWSIHTNTAKRDVQSCWEKPEGYLAHVSGYLNFEFVYAVMDLPGLLKEFTPLSAVHQIRARIQEELRNLYEGDLNLDLSAPLSTHINAGLQETPFLEIIGAASPPTRNQWAPPPAPTWLELDLFLAKTMDKFGGSPAQGLDPLKDLDVSINVTWPEYLNIQGRISNLTFHGVSDIRHAGSYSPIFNGLFYVYSEYPNAYLSGVHNLTGTWTLESGEVIQVGGVESQFTFKAKPAESTLMYGYSNDTTNSHIVLESLRSQGFGLKAGEYSTNFDGLLDAIPEGRQKDQGTAWIQDAIQTPVSDLIIEKIEYRVAKFLDNAFKQTTYEEIANPTNLRK